MVDLQIDDERLETVAEIAEIVGDRTVVAKKTADTERKEDESIVTEADREAEQIIRKRLKSSYSYPILGEEFGGDISEPDTYWVVDPIDGTHNFANHQPLYGTAIALVENNEPSLGVFYMPEMDYMFYAVEGEGAYRNQEKLRVSENVSADEAYYNISGIGRAEIHPDIAEFNKWIQQLGCALMAESWVASGWCDVGVFGAFGPWDVATGIVLVRESGGVAKSVVGDNSTDWTDMMNGRVVMGDENLVNEVLEELPRHTEEELKKATYDY